MDWRIYYSDRTADGTSKADWLAAPDDDVQVVVVMTPPKPPYPDRFETGFCYCGHPGRTFYTGVDGFDPLGYGHMKAGALLADEAYARVWEMAYADD